jgi:hypothetical protein
MMEIKSPAGPVAKLGEGFAPFPNLKLQPQASLSLSFSIPFPAASQISVSLLACGGSEDTKNVTIL